LVGVNRGTRHRSHAKLYPAQDAMEKYTIEKVCAGLQPEELLLKNSSQDIAQHIKKEVCLSQLATSG
jgi:hypothetical protein